MLPEVADCELEARDASVLGSWRVAPGTADVLVTRAEGSSELSTADMRRIPASLAGFHDTEAQPGTRYYYRIRAVYVSGAGERWITPGIGQWATPEAPLDVVGDLRADIMPGAELEAMLSWQAIETGTVMIYRSDRPPPWPPGTSIGLAELGGHGRPVPGQPVPGAQRGDPAAGAPAERPELLLRRHDRCEPGDDRAGRPGAGDEAGDRTAGRTPRRQAPARLAVGRRLPHVPGAVAARGGSAAATPPAECGLRRFDDDGGFEIDIGPQPGTRLGTLDLPGFRRRDRVRAGRDGGPGPGRDGSLCLPAEETRWTPWRRSRLVLTADQAVRMPPLVVVHSLGRVMPLRPEQGTPILRLPETESVAGRVVVGAHPGASPARPRLADLLPRKITPARASRSSEPGAGGEHARLPLLLQPVRYERDRLPLHGPARTRRARSAASSGTRISSGGSVTPLRCRRPLPRMAARVRQNALNVTMKRHTIYAPSATAVFRSISAWWIAA